MFWRRRKSSAEVPLTVEEVQTIEEGARKTREGVFGRVSALFRQPVIDEETWDQLAELLVESDMGPQPGVPPG